MCARYVSVRSDDDISDELDAVNAVDEPTSPDYNIAPTDPVRIVVNRPLRSASGEVAESPTKQLRSARWGLVPSWSKDRKGAARMINARIETVSTARAFKQAYAKRRCLVPADGWYEWQTVDSSTGPRKQARFMTPEDGHLLAFAGLYEFWRPEDGPTLTTCTIVTAPAIGVLTQMHDRMPLVLPREAWGRWLDPSTSDPADVLTAWDEAAGERLELRPVSTEVNSVKADGPQLITRVDDLDAGTLF